MEGCRKGSSMKIVILGASTEYKKYFILSMARLFITIGTVCVFTHVPYGYDDENQPCELFMVPLRRYGGEEDLRDSLDGDDADFQLVDMTEAMSIGSELKAIVFCEPERGLFEATAGLTRSFTMLYPYTDLYLVYARLPEFGRVGGAFLQALFNRRLKGAVNSLRHFELFDDEAGRQVFLEAMYEERFRFRRLSPSFKLQLLELFGVITGVAGRDKKKYLRKAERMK